MKATTKTATKLTIPQPVTVTRSKGQSWDNFVARCDRKATTLLCVFVDINSRRRAPGNHQVRVLVKSSSLPAVCWDHFMGGRERFDDTTRVVLSIDDVPCPLCAPDDDERSATTFVIGGEAWVLVDAAYHRNGIGGSPYVIATLLDQEGARFVGVMFEDSFPRHRRGVHNPRIVVLPIDALANPDMAMASMPRLRGDCFEEIMDAACAMAGE